MTVSGSAKVVVLPPDVWAHPECLIGPRDSTYPYISGDMFRALCEHVFDEQRIPLDTDAVKAGDAIYVNIRYMNYYVQLVHPFIQNPYVLITGNDDNPAPGEFKYLLDDHAIIAWFGMNPDIDDHPKFFPIPIGIKKMCSPGGDPAIITNAINDAKFVNKTILLSLNFDDNTNYVYRSSVRALFKDKDWCTIFPHKPFEEYMFDLVQTKFVLCPRGNGLDCYRQWEAMLVGAIPIMIHSTLDPLFDGLPVILIDDWTEVTKNFLLKKYRSMQEQKFEMDRMYAPYWINNIEQIKKLAKEKV